MIIQNKKKRGKKQLSCSAKPKYTQKRKQNLKLVSSCILTSCEDENLKTESETQMPSLENKFKKCSFFF